MEDKRVNVVPVVVGAPCLALLIFMAGTRWGYRLSPMQMSELTAGQRRHVRLIDATLGDLTRERTLVRYAGLPSYCLDFDPTKTRHGGVSFYGLSDLPATLASDRKETQLLQADRRGMIELQLRVAPGAATELSQVLVARRLLKEQLNRRI